MSRPRRDILLFAALALVAAVIGWFVVTNRPGAAIDAYANGAKARDEAAKPKLADAKAFRATICAASPCVLVEAGGLAFVVGAGEGAEEGLASRGLMRADLDAVLLTDVSFDAVAGLLGLAQRSFGGERSDPLTVFGPEGALRVVDGANVVLSALGPAKLVVGIEGEDQGIEGKVVFDSGIVAIRAFTGTGPGRVYRFDFDGKSLVVAGCLALSADIVAAARGTKAASGILAAGAPGLLKTGQPAGQPQCLDAETAVAAAGQAKLSAALLAPIYPSTDLPGAMAAWKEIVAGARGGSASAAGPGSMLDLSGAAPVVRLAN